VREGVDCILGPSEKPQVSGHIGPTMDFSTETLSRLVLIAIGLGVLALALSASAAGRRRKQGPVEVDDALHDILEGQSNRIGRLESAVKSLATTDRRHEGLIEGAVRHVGLVRYDAFEDVGGRLSFSCALLDDHGSGVVMTSINGRADTRVYAKPVSEGQSQYNLSLEEEEAIRQALAGPRVVSAT
jgi:Protein of unknown function (DUF4446)